MGEAHAALAPTRVFLAEDDTEMRIMVAAVLRKDGYHVTELKSGQELLDAVSRTLGQDGYVAEPDLIISDVRMPGFWGLDVLATLRRTDWETPVILITGFGDIETHTEASLLGAAAVIDKPFDLDAFREKVQSIAAP